MYEGSIARVGLALWGTESVQAIAEHARAAEAAGFDGAAEGRLTWLDGAARVPRCCDTTEVQRS